MKHQIDYKYVLVALALFLTIPELVLHGQEEGDDAAAADSGDAGGGDAGSAAEGAVTSGSVSQPAAATSGAVESNPMVTMVRTGLVSFDDIKTLSISDLIIVVSSGGDITKIVEGLKEVAKGADPKEVVENIKAETKVILRDLGFTEENLNDTEANYQLLYAHVVTDDTADPVTTLSADDIKAIDALLGAEITITQYLALRNVTFTTAQIQSLLTNGFTATYLNGESDLATLYALTITNQLTDTELGQMATLINSHSYILTDIYALVAAELTFADLTDENTGELDSDKVDYILSQLSSPITDKDKLLTKAETRTWSTPATYLDIYDQIIDDVTWFSAFSTNLEAAGTLADQILTDRTVATEADLGATINVDSLAAAGYTTELLRILAKYGAIGSDSEGSKNALSDTLANAVLGQDYPSDSSKTISEILKTSSTDYLANLANLGAQTFADEDKDSTVLDVKLSNVSLSTGADINFNADATVDVSTILTPAKNGSAKERKVHVIGAAKDLTIKGDVTFLNDNTAEDHALAIGAADDIHIASGSTVKYTGSNLGIGSNDTMTLVNVNMETGGNLALASLDELHISTTGNYESTFTVGNGGDNDSPDNVYLYANDLIKINGLKFSGNLDDVYMEAVIINLKDVVFPANAEVMLRAGDGSLHFDSYDSPSRGVNLTEVVHKGIGDSPLIEADFEGVKPHRNSIKTFENNTPMIRIRAQQD